MMVCLLTGLGPGCANVFCNWYDSKYKVKLTGDCMYSGGDEADFVTLTNIQQTPILRKDLSKAFHDQ